MNWHPFKSHPYFSAAAIIFAASLFVNYLAIPNMLSHDQLSVSLVILKTNNPNLFTKDAFFQDPGWFYQYSAGYTLFDYLSRLTGSFEETYRVLVPVSFFFFVFGMFVFLYGLGIRPFLAVLGVAALSSIYIPQVLLEDWGIPGPSETRLRFLGLTLITYCFFAFYKYINHKNLLWLFLFIGFIGNIHAPTAFFVTILFLAVMALQGGLTIKNIKRMALAGCLAIVGMLPYLIIHYLIYPAPKIIIEDAALYKKALLAAYPHLSFKGIVGLYKDYFLTRWYSFWPLFGIFVFMLIKRRNDQSQTEESRRIDSTSLWLFAVIVVITVAVSAANQFVQSVQGRPPFTIQEPRIFRYVYFPLYLYLGFFFFWIWQKSLWLKQKKIIIALLIILVGTGGAAIGYTKYTQIKRLLFLKKTFKESGDTCRSPLYGWINGNLPKDSVFLIDPNKYPSFRNCTLQNLVYTYRDSVYAPYMNYMTEWYKRKLLLEDAYSRKDPSSIVKIAKDFNADYIVSFKCIEIPGLQKLYETTYEGTEYEGIKENCVYKVNS